MVIENNGEVEELNQNVEEAVERLETRYRKLSAFEILDVVKDKHGIDHAKRAVIVNFGLTTRCSYVVLSQASSGKYFVQKRSALKDSYPSMLDPAPGKRVVGSRVVSGTKRVQAGTATGASLLKIVPQEK